MQGKTLGDNNGIAERCVAPSPTLVMLVGCFQDGEIFGPEHIDGEVEGGGEEGERQVGNREDTRGRLDEASRLCVLSKGMQMGGSAAAANMEVYPEDMRADAIAQEEDRIRFEYLRLVGQTMSEVLDGLEWIERVR